VQAPTATFPTDDQFFSKPKKGKPDVVFLKDHFYREGRIKEDQALYIVKKATKLFRVEPNVLTVPVDTPVIGARCCRIQVLSTYQFLQSAVTSLANTCAFH